MHSAIDNVTGSRSRGRTVAVAAAVLLVCALGALAPSAAAKPAASSIVLPGATSAEGIAVGTGSTFFDG